jgi:hypothetical protein
MIMQSEEPLTLNYANPVRRRVSVLAVIGLGLAMWSLAMPAMMWWFLWENIKHGAHTTSRIDGGYYVLPAAALALSAMGFRGRPKVIPTAGTIIALIATGATLLAVARTW